MRHTVIAWDSSYRNFFHLVQGLRNQDYDGDEYELIYVEQRSKAFANEYAKNEGVDSLWDLKQAHDGEFDFRVEYLGDDPSVPYHVGRCVNRGLELARGEYISVMDGDMLLPPDFLDSLDRFHEGTDAIANLIRRTASEPVSVSKDNWKDAVIDYERCLEVCPDRGEPIPDEAPNYAPLISAHEDHWDAINGYSDHKVWATECTMDGTDVTKRLEMVADGESRPLPDTVAAHPWHPIGFNRNAYESKKFYRNQERIIDWTVEHEVHDWTERTEFTEQVYRENAAFVDEFVNQRELRLPGTASLSDPSLLDKLLAEASTIRAEHEFNDAGAWPYVKSKVRRTARRLQQS